MIMEPDSGAVPNQCKDFSKHQLNEDKLIVLSTQCTLYGIWNGSISDQGRRQPLCRSPALAQEPNILHIWNAEKVYIQFKGAWFVFHVPLTIPDDMSFRLFRKGKICLSFQVMTKHHDFCGPKGYSCSMVWKLFNCHLQWNLVNKCVAVCQTRAKKT